MKFMKLGSKPDSFQTDGNDVRVMTTEYSTDFIVNVGDVRFYVHKFPLLSKSYRMQKMYSSSDEIHIPDIPGGAAAFEICAKFCYGMTVTINAYNVVAARCAAGYLEMYQTIDTGNLVSKIDAFLDTSIFHSWKDSIVVLRTTKSLLPCSEDLKLVSRCIDSIASKASVDTSKVDWSYKYNRKKLPSESGLDLQWNGVRKQQSVPKDWWVEDLCELEIDNYKRVIAAIKAKGRISGDVLGEALKAYTYIRLPVFSKLSMIDGGDVTKARTLLETVVWLLPADKDSVSCSFLLKVLRAATLLDCGQMFKKELVKQIGRRLDGASVHDLLIPAAGDVTTYDIDTVLSIVEFTMQDTSGAKAVEEFQEIKSAVFVSDSSKISVAKLVDGYLTEIAKDPKLPLLKFVKLAEMVPGDSRPVHDGLYRAIDMYLMEHPGLSKCDRKKLCGSMDCRRLSAEARVHAVQNERLPTRVVIQILLFEQIRSFAAAGSSSGSSRPSATTNTEDSSDVAMTVDDLKSMKLAGGGRATESSGGSSSEASKVKGIVRPKKLQGKLWSIKGQGGEDGGSDTSGSLGSANLEEPKPTPSRNNAR